MFLLVPFRSLNFLLIPFISLQKEEVFCLTGFERIQPMH